MPKSQAYEHELGGKTKEMKFRSNSKAIDHVDELERIRRFSNMEASFPDAHFDRDQFSFQEETKTYIGVQKSGIKPFPEDDVAKSLNRTVSFPVREKTRQDRQKDFPKPKKATSLKD